ncbi:MAG: DUF421 domain-containing protein [Negativicutes bacterium]|nr:DUF421 domain-containing protein [Negativicutes bacterium]
MCIRDRCVMFSYEAAGQVLLRMAFIFAVALVVVRVMGNRAIGQFSPFDFVLMVGIGDIVANVALDTEYSLLSGAEGLLGLLFLQQLLARASLKNTTLRKWFEGTPVVIVQDGKIIRENLVKTQFNLDDLRQELHKHGLDMTNLKDIKLARLESCGDFTVVKEPDVEPLTKQQFEIALKKIFENPLSPAGAEFKKLQQFIADVHYLTEHIKRQEAKDAGGTNEAPQYNPVKELH